MESITLYFREGSSDKVYSASIDPKDGGHVDLRSQLGGEGRAVLTSSASTQFSFDASESGLSTYTQYIVNGIATGEADLNHDGQITIDELHEYAKARVQISRPAMSPQILPTREGYSIVISAARKADPGRAYLPREGLEPVVTHAIATTLELEDRAQREVTINRLLP